VVVVVVVFVGVMGTTTGQRHGELMTGEHPRTPSPGGRGEGEGSHGIRFHQNAVDAVKYATEAIDSAEGLVPTVRVPRIYTLRKVIAAARLSTWQQAAATGADPARIEAARVATRDAAEEWLGFARDNDLDQKAPGRVCAAVGGCTDR
jgi:hypothetical protein